MPIIKSAKKRVKTTRAATIRNAKTKRTLKSALKAFVKSPSAKTLGAAQSEIDTAAKKNVIHKNKAARLKSHLAASAKANNVKAGAGAKKSTSSPAKKSTPKTTTVKKTAAKKPASKKSSTKKPAKG